MQTDMRSCMQKPLKTLCKASSDGKSCDYEKADNFYVMIGDLGYRREDYQLIAAAEKNVAVFINHISGRDFYNYVKHTQSRASFYRMPCMYDFEEQNYLFEEEAGEFLGIFKKEKGMRFAKKFVQKHFENWCNRNRKGNWHNAHSLNACRLLCQRFKSKDGSY